MLLRATAEWAARFHHPERPMEPSASPAGPQEAGVVEQVEERVKDQLPPRRPAIGPL